MIKVGIIGCGNIADQHANHISRINGTQIVGTCDVEELMAKQLSDRYKISFFTNDVDRMLEEAKPDVVHITTPGQSHYALGKKCLEAGCHIYVEKPFTSNADEAAGLIKIAEEKNLKMTVGHNLQFNHAARRMRRLIKDGYLGGPPVHMESYYGYNLGDQKYAKALLGDKNHWIRKLPGKLMHNVISHGVSKIAEFMQSETPTVIAHGFTSPLLKSIGETDIIDEARVIIQDKEGPTAYFTFSTQMRPVLRHFRIFGPANALIVDDDEQTLLKVKGNQYKSYLNQFIPPLNYAKQGLGNCGGNIFKFLKKDFHMDGGMKHLINLFYKSIKDNDPVPICYNEIYITSKIMEMIFSQLKM